MGNLSHQSLPVLTFAIIPYVIVSAVCTFDRAAGCYKTNLSRDILLSVPFNLPLLGSALS